jgi:hypothetical protein
MTPSGKTNIVVPQRLVAVVVELLALNRSLPRFILRESGESSNLTTGAAEYWIALSRA